MEGEFSEIYQRLISRIEPDPTRLLQGLQALRCVMTGADPPGSESRPLQSDQKCDIQGTECVPDPVE